MIEMAGVPWVRIDVDYFRNPKVNRVSSASMLVHLASILYCADQLTDGAIPASALATLRGDARLPSMAAARRAASELVAARLWEINGDGWRLPDFAEMNARALRATVEHERARWRENQRRHRGVTR